MKNLNLKVSLKERSYIIETGNEAFNNALKTISALVDINAKAVVITDENVFFKRKKEISLIRKSGADVIVLPAGEKTKSFKYLEKIFAILAELKVDRKSALFAFGGGVMGDLVGYAAASWLRGIDFYQIPTTLLAMVDSSVGGKTAVNIKQGKNLVGAFYQPKAVYIDVSFLKTLPKREFAAGMAEVIKYGILYDKKLFSTLEKSADNLEKIIHRCCQLKADVVSSDEKETAKDGGRALLNLGHTFGHAIENCAGYGVYLHGEAVALGTVIACKIAIKLGEFTQEDLKRVEKIFKKYSLPVKLDKNLKKKNLLEAITKDKKSDLGKIRFILPQKIGLCKIEPFSFSQLEDLYEEK